MDLLDTSNPRVRAWHAVNAHLTAIARIRDRRTFTFAIARHIPTLVSNGFPESGGGGAAAAEAGESQTTGNDAPSASDDDDDGDDDGESDRRQPHFYPPALLSFDSLSAYTELNRTRVYSLIRQGRFPRPLKFGKTSRWRKSDVDNWINAEAAAQLEG